MPAGAGAIPNAQLAARNVRTSMQIVARRVCFQREMRATGGSRTPDQWQRPRQVSSSSSPPSSYHVETVESYRTTVVAMCDALRQCLTPSFGPAGADTVLVGSAGGSSIVVTKSGASIFEQLRVAHPVGRFLVKAVHDFSKVIGDATTTFALVLCAAVRHAFLGLQRSQWAREPDTVQLRRLVAGFEHVRHHFETFVADPIVRLCSRCSLPPSLLVRRVLRKLKPVMPSTTTTTSTTRISREEEVAAMRMLIAKAKTEVYHLVVTMFGASFSVEAAGALAATLVSWVFATEHFHGCLLYTSPSPRDRG